MELKEDLISPPQSQLLDREAWSGVRAYKSCYCCHGTGYVVRVERVLKLPHPFTRPMLCKRIGCTAVARVQIDPRMVDDRLTPEECQELHELGLVDWQEAERNWHENRQKAQIEKMSEGATKRLGEEGSLL
ncbi:hypothetical protein [Lusitaniella coriacea]|uniref:hypothetical protein n=1 Tax=Lusitaniella coriacea TaxID=1983105 RepID=UPI003CEE1940